MYVFRVFWLQQKIWMQRSSWSIMLQKTGVLNGFHNNFRKSNKLTTAKMLGSQKETTLA